METTCEVCGKPVKNRPGRRTTRFCSMKCRRASGHWFTCGVCGKPYKVSPAHITTTRFCSPLCRNTFKKRNQKFGKCKGCGAPFLVTTNKNTYCRRGCMHRSKKAKCAACNQMFIAKWRSRDHRYARFCSRKCACRGKRTGAYVTCAVCGKKSWRWKSKLAQSATGRYYCSLECRNQGMIDERCGKSHKHGTSVTQNGYISIAKERRECSAHGHRTRRIYRPMHRLIVSAVLGRKITSDEPVWHIDGDLTNNLPSNLFLYPTRVSMWRAIGQRDFPTTSNLPGDAAIPIEKAMRTASQQPLASNRYAGQK